MVSNNPISALQSSSPSVGKVQTDDASRAPAVGALARAALASVAAARAALQASVSGTSRPATAIPRIPLHLLGTGTGSANASAGVLPAPPDAPFVAIPDNDTLSIIAGYLPQEDQLRMRDIDASVRAVVDPTIQTLRLSAHEACAVLTHPETLRHLRELHLTACTDETLIELAAKLAKMPKTDFVLSVISNPLNNLVSADGIKPLAALHLSGLRLKDVPVPAEMSRVLAGSVAPLTLHLPYLFDVESDVFEISQLPKLHSLSVGRQRLTPETIDALRSHSALERLHVHTLYGNDVCTLARSASLRDLSIGIIRDREVDAIRALADNRVLTSLDVGGDRTDSLVALSQNVTLQALSISVYNAPSAVLSALATMPALEHFAISARGMRAAPVDVAAIQALCTKPLKSLSFKRFSFDSATRSLIANAQTASLRLDLCTSFDREEFALLSQNRSITELLVHPGTANTTNDRDVLSLVTSSRPELESLMIRVIAERPDIAEKAIQTAWVASGRQLSKLQLDIVQVAAAKRDA